MKKSISIILIIALLASLSVGMWADGEIPENRQFKTVSEANAAYGTTYNAGDKIKVGGIEYEAIDSSDDIDDLLGSYYLVKNIEWSNTNIGNFKGSFNGGDHEIKVKLHMFNEVGGANSVISNFTIIGDATAADTNTAETSGFNSRSGKLAKIVKGGSFKNIINKVDVTGSSSYIAGLVGVIGGEGNNAKIVSDVVFENCVNYGDIASQKSNNVGGIAASVSTNKTAQNYSITFRNCANYGDLSTQAASKYSVGGILGIVESSKAQKISFEYCANYGDLRITHSNNRVGGILSDIRSNADVGCDVEFNGCVNEGVIYSSTGADITADNGIFGSSAVSAIEVKKSACVNGGTIQTSDTYSGFIQYGHFDGNNYVRFVMLISESEIETADFIMTITLDGRSIDLKEDELSTFLSVDAAGKEFAAESGYQIFGVAINIGQKTSFESASVKIVSQANGSVLYSAGV